MQKLFKLRSIILNFITMKEVFSIIAMGVICIAFVASTAVAQSPPATVRKYG